MKTWIKTNRVLIGLLLFMPVANWLAGHLDDYFYRILMLAGINVVLATSLNLVNGITGQFSLGHAGFMAVGAYTSACVTYFVGHAYVSPFLETLGEGTLASVLTQLFFFVAIIVGGLSAALLGFVVGMPSLRLRGDYLAIVTLGFGEITRVIILNIDAVGGARGFADIPAYSSFHWIYGMVILTVVILYRLVHSSHGRAFLAVREDEVAAEAVGISTTHYKVLAFVVSAFFAGVAGALFAHFLSYINPSIFTFIKSFEVITMVVLGGMGSLSGSILAAIGLTILPEALRPLQDLTKIDFRMVIYSLLLVILMLTRPMGLFGKKELWEFARRKS